MFLVLQPARTAPGCAIVPVTGSIPVAVRFALTRLVRGTCDAEQGAVLVALIWISIKIDEISRQIVAL